MLTANGAWRDNEAANPTFGANNDWFGATQLTATGYHAEFKIKKSALSNRGQEKPLVECLGRVLDAG